MPISVRLPSQFSCLRHIIGALLLVLATLGLSGCSAVKLSYNNAPELTYWWLDSYLDLNETQSLKLRSDLTALQAWHRQMELPQYVSTLERLQRLAATEVTPLQVCTLYEELRPRLQVLLDRAEPTLVALAPTLTATQLEHLARQFNKRNGKWRAEWLDNSAAEQAARRAQQLTDRAEHFYGPLEEAQLAMLRASVARSVFDADVKYRETLRRQQDALQTLRQLQADPGPAGHVKTAVHALLERTLNSPAADYRSYAERSTQENCRLLATLHNSATPAQRQRLLETLQDYAADARSLMAPSR
ncbi:MAG: DUF6279 family lipoprotein [Rhodoferax sp.]|uniref:DUF6279 family lipoprotein n=1 Tax=Rhodoferax sp. TaxID=50421 RepID=UPI0026080ED2|nr:DUF6279 family lipoprotein [Rhodoferax sp.]MDD5332390.1 DUF6279 family lipoprotein [Rhodoferax sp.]